MRRGRALLVVALGLAACRAGPDGEPSGEALEVVVPRGASLATVTDSLSERGILPEREVRFFRLYARLKGLDREIHAGQYRFRTGVRWSEILAALTEGHVVTERVTIPEGFTLTRMAERLAAVSRVPADTVLEVLLSADSAVTKEMGLPGPGLEGYLFPDTYLFEPGTPVDRVVQVMALRYRSFWTEERRAHLAGLEMTEREVVTLASIIQAEALWDDEMPLISGVYHNRLRIGLGLYADPTVLYALGGSRERLLYAAIDSVADNPYNTYTQPGLPPGPIGSPGEAALEAALHPADTHYLYFVAQPDGRHVFSATLAEHNVAKAAARRAWNEAERAPPDPDPEPEADGRS